MIPANTMTTGLAGTYTYAYTYTPVTGKPLTATLPAVGGLAKEKVVTRYNGDGLTESTSGQSWYTADATYSPFGEVLRTVSGSQPHRVWTTNFVDPRTGRLQRTVADRETAAPHRITDSYYSYDASGTMTSNARKLSEASGTTWDNQCFTYDAMGELVNAWTSKVTPTGNGTGCTASNGTSWGYRTDYETSSGPVADAPDAAADTTSPDASLTSTLAAAAPGAASVSASATAYHQSFTYSWVGNRATLTEHDTADASKNVTLTSGYEAQQPHTMKWISSNPSGKGGSYSYDAAGNTQVRDLSNTTQDLTWTSDNKLDTITDDGTKTTYVYDAEGKRILENSPSGSTLYLGETELTTNASGSVTKASRVYAQTGAPTVVRTTAGGATTGHKLNVLLADHIGTGTTSVELTSGQPVTRRAFKPYGEIRGTKPSSWPDKRSYLGVGIDDAATGLTHLGAREYDQASGRFLSADPVVDLSDPLQMNGYVYGRNSPVSSSDPSGLFPILIPGGPGPKPTPKPNTDVTVRGVRTIYDGGGKPHVIGVAGNSKASEKLAFKYMNEDLELAGKYYDKKTRTGSMFLWQNENAGEGEARTYQDKAGNLRITGATADFVKVTWNNGKIVSVDIWDANDSTRSAGNLGDVDKTVRRKMDPSAKAQTNNVVFVAKDFEQASEMRDRFANHGNVRIIHPDSNFDTMRQAPLVRRVSGGTIRITPGEQIGRGGAGGTPSAPRPGPRGSAGGKFLNGAGVFGELLTLYQFAKEWNTIGNGGCVPFSSGDCEPPHEM